MNFSLNVTAEIDGNPVLVRKAYNSIVPSAARSVKMKQHNTRARARARAHTHTVGIITIGFVRR